MADPGMHDAPLRSLLFVPGDSEKKLSKIADCGADAVIIDLEDAVAPAHKDAARVLTAQYLMANPVGARPVQLWVRVNPIDSGLTDDDLAAVMGARPDGIMQPKIDGPQDVAALSTRLDTLENARDGRLTRIIPVATETAIAPFRLGDFASANLPRLAGLTWGAEDLATALGASRNRQTDGRFTDVFRMVRSLCLLAARAANVQPIDTLYADFRDSEGLAADSRDSCADGFTGRLAIHPAQVAVINAGYLPDAAALEHARAVVAAFAASPGAGAVGLDGKMLDRPHLAQAERILATAARYANNRADMG